MNNVKLSGFDIGMSDDITKVMLINRLKKESKLNNVKLSGSYQGGLYVLTVQYGNTNDEQTVVSISHSSLEKCANFIDWIIKNEK